MIFLVQRSVDAIITEIRQCCLFVEEWISLILCEYLIAVKYCLMLSIIFSDRWETETVKKLSAQIG